MNVAVSPFHGSLISKSCLVHRSSTPNPVTIASSVEEHQHQSRTIDTSSMLTLSMHKRFLKLASLRLFTTRARCSSQSAAEHVFYCRSPSLTHFTVTRIVPLVSLQPMVQLFVAGSLDHSPPTQVLHPT